MPYTFEEILPADDPATYFTDDGNGECTEIEDLRIMERFEILDNEGIQICIVHSEDEAEALISHLNRG